MNRPLIEFEPLAWVEDAGAFVAAPLPGYLFRVVDGGPGSDLCNGRKMDGRWQILFPAGGLCGGLKDAETAKAMAEQSWFAMVRDRVLKQEPLGFYVHEAAPLEFCKYTVTLSSPISFPYWGRP